MIRPVNRLDRDTSGVVVFAKSEYIHACLAKQMKSGLFRKEYTAVLNGILESDKGTIDAPIARKEGSIIQRCVSESGQPSITHFEVLKRLTDSSLVQFTLETGRTHQIRVHSSHIGHPIIGDTLYGFSSNLISRQALHSHKISFIHPITKKHIEHAASLPDDILNIL
ncbi:MAG: RluA family pseudouridine synthase [Oscillospiraceae bacterium]|nr:RluA family pseudouridine synthase [Oscillospiraceae bacterium]